MGQDAIAMGIDVNGEELQEFLFNWADRIILVDKTLDRIPEKYRNKLKIWDVGGDRFFRGFEQDLLDMYVKYINEEGL